MVRTFRIIVLVSVLLDSQCVNGTERVKVISSTETRVILGECKSESEPDELKPAEYFDKIWGIINDEFWDPNFNGVDWLDARKRYRSKAVAAEDNESFAEIVNQMLAELKTSHTRYYTKWDPGYYIIQVVFGKPDTHRSGIGVVTKKIEGRHYVIAVIHSSPAEEAGVLFGDWLVEADGQSFHPIRSFFNKAAQEIGLIIQRGPLESTRKKLKITPVDMKEKDRLGDDSHASLKTIEYKGHRFAYVRLWWLRGIEMKNALEYGIYRANETEGIIIDIRDGYGGDMGYEFIAPFLQYGLGDVTVESIGRKQTFKTLAGCKKPVVVLINSGSRSGKEVLAYLFKKTGRGLLVGERTAGYVTGGNKREISSDSFLLYGAGDMLIDGMRLEGVGVEPDIVVPFDIRFAAGKDIQLQRAKEEIVRLIEASN